MNNDDDIPFRSYWLCCKDERYQNGLAFAQIALYLTATAISIFLFFDPAFDRAKLGLSVGLCLFHVALCVLLYFGISKKIKACFWPWLILYGLYWLACWIFVITVWSGATSFSSDDKLWYSCLAIALSGFLLYLWASVFEEHQRVAQSKPVSSSLFSVFGRNRVASSTLASRHDYYQV